MTSSAKEYNRGPRSLSGKTVSLSTGAFDLFPGDVVSINPLVYA